MPLAHRHKARNTPPAFSAGGPPVSQRGRLGMGAWGRFPVTCRVRGGSVKGDSHGYLASLSPGLWISGFAFLPNKAASDARKILLARPWECAVKGQPPAQISAAACVNVSMFLQPRLPTRLWGACRLKRSPGRSPGWPQHGGGGWPQTIER